MKKYRAVNISQPSFDEWTKAVDAMGLTQLDAAEGVLLWWARLPFKAKFALLHADKPEFVREFLPDLVQAVQAMADPTPPPPPPPAPKAADVAAQRRVR